MSLAKMDRKAENRVGFNGMRTLSFIFLTLTTHVHSQEHVKNRDIIGEWFSTSKDSTFFKADTVIMIKSTNREVRDDVKVRERSFIEPRSELTGSDEYINLEFRKGKELIVWVSYAGGAYGALWTNPMRWALKNNELKVTLTESTWSYRITAVDSISFDRLASSNPERYVKHSTPVLILVRTD